MDSPDESKERDLYASVETWLRPLLEAQFASVHLEITAHKTFSNTLKQMVSPNRDIIFSFLKDTRPDLTGFVKGDRYPSPEFIVVEVKNRPIKLVDIYQLRRYADLLDAHYALLLSPEIPEEIMRLSRALFPYLTTIPGAGKHTTLVRFREGGNSVEWFPDDPFVKR